MKAEKNAKKTKQTIILCGIFAILLAALLIILNIKRVDVQILGFRTELEETDVAELGIEYQIPNGKAKNGLETVKPSVHVTLDGKDIPIEHLRFVPDVKADYQIHYEYALADGETKECTTVLTVKDTQKPSIIGAEDIDSKVTDGAVLDFSKITVVDRSREDIGLQVSAYKVADEKREQPLEIADNKIKLSAANEGYTVVLAAEDSSGNKAEIIKNIEFAEKGEFEFANNEEYVKKYAYGSHGASVSYNSKPEYIFEGTGSIKYELTSDIPWPCFRLAKPFITDLTGSYGLSFWVYNDSEYWAPLAFCQKFTADTKCAPHSWTNVIVTTEQMEELLPKQKDKNLPVGIVTDMTDFDLMYNNVDSKYNMVLYFDTFEVLYQEPKYSIALDKDVKTVMVGKNIELSTPTVVGFDESKLEVTVLDSKGEKATEVVYKNGKYIAKELKVGEYTVSYFYKNGRYGCTANQKLRVASADEYDTLKRYVSDYGTIEIEKSITHGKDGSFAAKYTNGQWTRWSFISIDDSDVGAVTVEDSIEFWLMYKKKAASDYNRLTVRLLTESDESVQLSDEIQLVEGEWIKISLNAGQMKKYLEAKDGLRLRVTIPEDTGENDLSYKMYFDDFKVVKGGNKLDIEATKRYASTNGTFSASTDIVHGTDGSLAAKYTNGQWMRWSFISIDDSDVAAAKEEDCIEFWIMYKKTATSDFNRLTARLLTESDESVQLSEELQLVEGQWTKVSLNAEQMRKYLKAKDGLRLRLTVPEDTGENDLSYELYIDDFNLIKGGNKLDIEATKRYASENGTLSASQNIVYGTDGSVAAKYTNGQWMRWSFISIDDSDIQPISEADTVEMWVRYERLADSDFDDLEVYMVPESDYNTILSEKVTLVEGEWAKVSISGSYMQTYLSKADGMRLQITTIGGEDGFANYNLYIDDFKVVKDGNKDHLEATKRYSSTNGILSASTDWSHGTDGSVAAKYVNGEWGRWSFISIDDSDIQPVNAADTIEMWVRYERVENSGFDDLQVYIVTENDFNTVISDRVNLVEGEWAKVTISGNNMKTYLDKADGMRLQITAVGGEDHLLSYALYIDDFKIIRNTTDVDDDAEAISRYTSSNGDISASKTIVHGEDGSIATKYANGQWGRWSFINIDDSDIQPVNAVDTIEIWVRYERIAVSEFDDLQVYMVTENDFNTVISDRITLVEGEWAKVTISGDNMKTYLDKADGMRLQVTAVGGTGEALWYNLYIDDFRIIRGEEEVVGDKVRGYSSAKGTLEEVTGPVHDRTDKYFTKFVSDSAERQAIIRVDDTMFRSGLTKNDSIRFYVYIEKDTAFDAQNVSISLAGNSSKEIPFGEWTLVTLNGEEMQKYLSEENSLKLTATAGPDEQGTNFGYTMYLTDVEVLKLANADITTDMLSVTRGNGTIEAGVQNHGLYSGSYVTFINGTWDTYPRIKIDDSAIKAVIEDGDSLEFWVYMEHNNGDGHGQAPFWISTVNDETPIGGRTTMAQNGQVWTKITLDAEGVRKYLAADDGLKICINMEVTFPSFKLTIGELAVVKNSTAQNYASTDGNIIKVGGPVYEKEGDVFTQYINNASLRQSFITINELAWPAKITKKDSIRFYVFAEKAAGFDAETLSLALVDDEGHSVVIKGDMTIPFGEWTMITLNGEEVQKYLDANKGLSIQLSAKPDEQGTNFGYTMYLTDVEVLKLANADITTDMLSVTRGNGTIEAGVQNHGLYSGSYVTFINGTWDTYPRIKIDDSKIKEVIEDGDSLEFWVYMEHNNGDGHGQAPFWLSTVNDDTPIGGQTTMAQNGQVWTKITLDAEGVRKYLAANDGLKISINMEVTYPSFKLTIGELAVVKK